MSKKNKTVKRGVGRPRATLDNLPPRGRKFDVKKAHELNPNVSLVAVYSAIKRMVKRGEVSKLRERKEHNGPGRPGWVFVRKVISRKATVPSVNLTTPAPAPAPVAEPVTA